MNWRLCQLFVFIKLSLSLAPHELIILILSQSNEYHRNLSENLRGEIFNQSTIIDKNNLINIQIIDDKYNNNPGYWTFIPILSDLDRINIINDNIKWLLLIEDQSYVNLKFLLECLNEEDSTKENYLGYRLYDNEATIIHHFAFFENPKWFSYPLIRSGVAFTIPLIKRLTKHVQNEKLTTDFFIDASHELSLFIWQNIKIENNNNNNNLDSVGEIHETIVKKKIHKNPDKMIIHREDRDIPSSQENGQNVKLSKQNERKLLMVHAPYFCLTNDQKCAIYPRESNLICNSINVEIIYFAIKTCKKFHKDRIPTIEMTWAHFVKHKRFFSDFEDKNIPTKSTGIPNTEIGHCTKTLSILKLALNDIELMNLKLNEKIEWIFLCDDDTLLSVSRVCEILGCFNSDENIYLGERYGYRLHSKDGFNYITGGGGIAFSLSTVRNIIKQCTCPTNSSPDDMIIGMCLQRLGIKPIHSSRFHQARPPDYSRKLLIIEKPISFHKFWQIDPYYVYEKWFKQSDMKMLLETRENLLKNCDINSSQSTNCIKTYQNGLINKKEISNNKSKPQRVDL